MRSLRKDGTEGMMAVRAAMSARNSAVKTKRSAWVVRLVVIALLFPAFYPLSAANPGWLLGFDLQARGPHAHDHGSHDHGYSPVPGVQGHPADHHCTPCEILKSLATLSINVRICPDVFTLFLPMRSMTSVAGVSFLDVFVRPISGWDLVLKNLEDRILAPIFCIIFFVPCLLIAIAIKLDSRGPVLFNQQRFGFNNNPINVLKFRTMYADRPLEAGVPQATRNDPRITRVGRFLRRTSLDELPQLWNVLTGEMSLVGPRPHAVDHNHKYAAMIDLVGEMSLVGPRPERPHFVEQFSREVPRYAERHNEKAGMTGWAQVNGLRGETNTVEQMRARVQYDLAYIDNWSLLFDLRILFLTLFVGFVNRRAY